MHTIFECPKLDDIKQHRRRAQTIEADARPEGDRAREAVVGLVLDHLSQAALGSVEEDGGVDASGTYFLLSTWQFCARIGVGNRVGGTAVH